jgi:hypothetical protein
MIDYAELWNEIRNMKKHKQTERCVYCNVKQFIRLLPVFSSYPQSISLLYWYRIVKTELVCWDGRRNASRINLTP